MFFHPSLAVSAPPVPFSCSFFYVPVYLLSTILCLSHCFFSSVFLSPLSPRLLSSHSPFLSLTLVHAVFLFYLATISTYRCFSFYPLFHYLLGTSWREIHLYFNFSTLVQLISSSLFKSIVVGYNAPPFTNIHSFNDITLRSLRIFAVWRD